jgi:hypothetical protein
VILEKNVEQHFLHHAYPTSSQRLRGRTEILRKAARWFALQRLARGGSEIVASSSSTTPPPA